MGEYISIPYHLSASAGSEGMVSIARVPGGSRLVTHQVNVTFPAACDYKLEVALYRGIKKVLPTEGVYAGDDTRVVDETPAVWGSDEHVILYFKNTDTANDHDCDILIEGELV